MAKEKKTRAARVLLTKTRVEGVVVPPDGRSAYAWDLEVRGFGVRVLASGLRLYVFKYGLGRRGKSRWVTIGEHGSQWTPDPVTGLERRLVVAVAREEARRMRGEVLAGRDPAEAKRAARAMPTLKEFGERYLEEYSRPHKAEASAAGDEQNLKHLVAKLGSMRMDQVMTSHVTRFHLERGTNAPVNANRCVGLLSHIFSMAVKWGVLPRTHFNPCTDVARFVETARKRYLSEQELVRVGAVLAEAEAGEGIYPEGELPAGKKRRRRRAPAIEVIRLLIFTGARIGEVVSLRWEHVDLERGVAMQKRKGHGAELQAIVLPAPARLLLDGIKHRGEWVFPGRHGKHLARNTVQHAWSRLRKKAKLEDVHVHDLRHSFASVAVAGGSSLPIIGALLGHTQVQTTQRYAHLSDDPLRAAADAAAARIDSALKRGAKVAG
jgi:integrase